MWASSLPPSQPPSRKELLTRCHGEEFTVAHLLSRGLLAAILPLFPRRLQLPVAFGVNFALASAQHILRRNVADGTVQADVVVMLDVALHEAPRIVQRKRCSGSDALAL